MVFEKDEFNKFKKFVEENPKSDTFIVSATIVCNPEDIQEIVNKIKLTMNPEKIFLKSFIVE